MDGNMSWMYHTEINFLKRKIVRKLRKLQFFFFSEDGREV